MTQTPYYTLSRHDALPISNGGTKGRASRQPGHTDGIAAVHATTGRAHKQGPVFIESAEDGLPVAPRALIRSRVPAGAAGRPFGGFIGSDVDIGRGRCPAGTDVNTAGRNADIGLRNIHGCP